MLKILIFFNFLIFNLIFSSDFVFEINEDGNTYTIKEYKGESKEIIIPNEVEGFKVTVIGERAFANKDLKSVKIGNYINKIEEAAFWNNKLTTIVIPDSITDIENFVFGGNKLKNISFGKNIIYIRKGAFFHNEITELEIPNTVLRIEEGAFQNNKLKAVKIPNKTNYIGRNAFGNNQFEKETEIKLGKGFNNYWIIENDNLKGHIGGFGKNLAIPNGIISIEERAFYQLGLESVVIPKTVTHIGKLSFGNNQLKDLKIEEGLIEIGEGAFLFNKLKNIIIPKTVKYIGEDAFGSQSGELEKVLILNKNIEIEDNAFSENDNFKIELVK